MNQTIQQKLNILKSHALLRGFIIIVAAVLADAVGSDYLRTHLRPSIFCAIKLLSVAFITWRAFLDNSNARATDAATAQSNSAPPAPAQLPIGPAEWPNNIAVA